MKLSEFDYSLPKDMIAQYPVSQRDKCRLMVLDRKTHAIRDRIFTDIADYIKAGDLLVLNDTKVILARLLGNRKTGGKVEIFLLEKKESMCEALVRPSGRIDVGEKIILESGHEVEILGSGTVGRFVQFNRSLDEILTKSGHVPLPPYIDRPDDERDRNDYQTVFSRKEGATASPTAGLHFTEELIEKVKGQGARVRFVTLHTNYGTFAPIKEEDVEKHKMHKEHFDLPGETAETILETKKNGGKVFAVGTTVARVLEHCASSLRGRPEPQGFGVNSAAEAIPKVASEAKQSRDCFVGLRPPRNDGEFKGYTNLYIYPGYEFKIVDHLITNFHLPKSTLLLLVSAFAGKDFIFEAYRHAIEKKYRFFSYGDAMLIL